MHSECMNIFLLKYRVYYKEEGKYKVCIKVDR